MKIRKIAAFVILAVSFSTGCASTWFENLKADPVAYVTRFEQQVENILSTAATIFNAIRPFIPAEKVSQIEQDYNKSIFAVRHGLAALGDAVQAAADAQNPKPDFSKLINDVIAAVGQMTAIIDEFRTGGTRIGAMPQVQHYPLGFEDLKTMKASIDKYKK